MAVDAHTALGQLCTTLTGVRGAQNSLSVAKATVEGNGVSDNMFASLFHCFSKRIQSAYVPLHGLVLFAQALVHYRGLKELYVHPWDTAFKYTRMPHHSKLRRLSQFSSWRPASDLRGSRTSDLETASLLTSPTQ